VPGFEETTPLSIGQIYMVMPLLLTAAAFGDLRLWVESVGAEVKPNAVIDNATMRLSIIRDFMIEFLYVF
jgi:hypothetical protein